MTRLVLLFEYATLSGGERSILATLDDVRGAGFDVTAIGPPTGPLAEELSDRGVGLLPLVTVDAEGNRFSQPRIREEIAQILRGLRPDLVHANSLSMGRLVGPVAADAGLTSISHLRDIVRLSRRAIEDLNCHRRLLAVSRATRDFHVAAGLSAERTRVLHNGVDLTRFCPRSATGYLHRELGIPGEARLLGTIGQIGLRKGQDVLLQAAGQLADVLPDVHYLVVGQRWSRKEESRQFEARLHQAATGPLRGRFHLLEYRDDVDRLLNELTLLIHPARQEPLGRVLLEAAASGVAVVASEVGGTAEIFPDSSRAARLVQPGDGEALVAAITELLGDSAARRSMAAAARRRAEAAFDITRATAGLIEQYREVLGE
jgi:glycosyltransferase involved in cell wall biosynthesis